MGEHTSSRGAAARKAPSLCNWLKELDKEVKKFPASANWQEHPVFKFARCRLFMMARYPRLARPFSDEILCREFSRGEVQISEHPSARSVVDDLNARQRTELAALFLDTITSLQVYGAYKPLARRVQKLAGEEPRRMRMLVRKSDKVWAALRELRDYAKSLDSLLGREYLLAADACLNQFEKLFGKPFDGEDDKKADPGVRAKRFLGKPKNDAYSWFFESIKSEYPLSLEDPTTLGMVQLYWLFRHGCELSGHESEVRVGMIRNAFWTKYDVSSVPLRRGTAEESKGCNAVHTAVLRFKQAVQEPTN
jgi:hypothetical protein